MELQPNTKYNVSFMYRAAITSGTGGLYVRLQQYAYDEQVAALATVSNAAGLTANTWNQFIYGFTTNADARFANLDLLLNNATGEVWIDHLDIRPSRYGTFG